MTVKKVVTSSKAISNSSWYSMGTISVKKKGDPRGNHSKVETFLGDPVKKYAELYKIKNGSRILKVLMMEKTKTIVKLINIH